MVNNYGMKQADGNWACTKTVFTNGVIVTFAKPMNDVAASMGARIALYHQLLHIEYYRLD